MELRKINISKIREAKYKLRFHTEKQGLGTLEKSIKENGLIVPLIVAKKDDYYELISGHRRLKVIKKLGWKEVDVIIYDKNPPDEIFTKAIVENVERLNLTPVERGFAYNEMRENLKISMQEIARRTGRTRVEVSYLLRIITRLHKKIRDAFRNGQISYGHARELLRIEDKNIQLELFNRLIKEDWTTRRTAVEVNLSLPQEKLKDKEKALNIIEMKVMKKLGDEYGQSVHFKQGKKKERIMIDYEDVEQLKSLLVQVLKSIGYEL